MNMRLAAREVRVRIDLNELERLLDVGSLTERLSVSAAQSFSFSLATHSEVRLQMLPTRIELFILAEPLEQLRERARQSAKIDDLGVRYHIPSTDTVILVEVDAFSLRKKS